VKRLAGLAVAVVCLASAGAGPARASAPPRSPLGYAISAVGFRSYFVFEANAGSAPRGTLRVLNLSGRARTIDLSPADVSTAAAGGLQYSEGTPHGEGSWLKLAARTVRLAGGGSTDVPFTVAVPSRAGAGDHFLAIVAIDRRVLDQRSRGHGGIRLRLIPRLAMTVEVRVPGPRSERLALGPIRIAVAPSGASLALRVSNPANTLIDSTTGELAVLQKGETLFEADTPLAAFVPKTRIDYHVAWQGTPAEGSYEVKGVLRPAGARAIAFDREVTFAANAIGKYRRQTGRRAIAASSVPTVLIVVLGLVAALAIAFATAYLRARRRLRERG
jgi:hypothetical protein